MTYHHAGNFRGAVFALSLGFTAMAGMAADWYVATNGAHTTGVDWSTAFTNVQAALDVAEPNDTIYLAGQTFVATQIAWSASSVTILGGHKAEPRERCS